MLHLGGLLFRALIVWIDFRCGATHHASGLLCFCLLERKRSIHRASAGVETSCSSPCRRRSEHTGLGMACRLTCSKVLRFFRSLTRKKPLKPEGEVSNFCCCLTTLDLVGLGIGSTLGASVYVLSGEVARKVAGPSIIISFLVAGVASIFAGLCYSEFGARVPKTGSAYLYSYVTVGEVWAFVAGWNLLLSYVIGTSSVAKAWTGTFDDLIDNNISQTLEDHTPMESLGLASYPDFFAAGLIMLLAGVLAHGVKESAVINTVFTAINVLVLIFIIIAGFIKGDLNNWRSSREVILDAILLMENFTTAQNETMDFGVGGFFPFGFDGTLEGAATCFYAFVGFDCIATTGEEVNNPQKAIPLAIVASLLICFLAYFGVSAALTLMMPYYLLDGHSPLPVAFEYIGWEPAKYVVAVGSLCALSTRYKEGPGLVRRQELFSLTGLLRPPSQPTHRTSKNVNIVLIIILLLVMALSVLLSEAVPSLRRRELWSMLLVSVLTLTLVLAVIIIWRQPQSTNKAAFMVPGVPIIPVLSILMNTYLMVQLGGETWTSYAIWMALGLIIYFGYGVRNSVQKQRLREARIQLNTAVNGDVVR
uniref:cationic amino acid transporter 2-like isoform X3 n=1 Tax=Gasterosteus aculeatus aculeatus TaxID=481459 RepID=UPI001A9809DD|nr:cationic amino acid transporter 2-like isoform X3 [Gasterosteus aculeatus aculeatus]